MAAINVKSHFYCFCQSFVFVHVAYFSFFKAVPTRIVKDNVPATSHEVTVCQPFQDSCFFLTQASPPPLILQESELAQARTASDIQKLGIQLLSRTGESKRKQQERERRRELASRQFRPNREIDHPAPSSSAIKVHFRKFKSSKCRYSRSRSHSSSRTSRSRSRETSRGRSRTSSMPLDSPPGRELYSGVLKDHNSCIPGY